MRYQHFSVLILLIGVFLISACSTAPIATTGDNQRIATAKRFLHNIEAGELAMGAFLKEQERNAREQPNIAEITKRAFANIKEEDFEDLVAEVYARHLSHKDLLEIAEFSERPAIQGFFKVIFDGVLSENKLNNDELIAKFSSDELIEIMQLSLSESFINLKEALPTINRELGQAGEAWGQKTLEQYIKNQ